MIASLYKRREKLAYIILLVLFVVISSFIIFDTPSTINEWLEVLLALFPCAFILVLAVLSRHKYNQLKDSEIPYSELSLVDLHHLVLKNDARVLPQLLFIEKQGNYVGTLKTIYLPWWYYPVAAFSNVMLSLLPVTMGFYTHDGELLFYFKRKGVKVTRLFIYDHNNHFLGSYVQNDFKNVINTKGKLFDEEDKLLLKIKVSGMSGDFDLRDDNNHRWAYFYNGKFPHEYTHVFNELNNDMVEISKELTIEEKMLLLSIIGYIFTFRDNRK
ncbi:hypothetical protein [Gracilibacillus kekensis]|uniref:Uncharacterized protein n=1 Tax=Gracilibacillus kekensis TaxID=1027249 RepID=A0A1M7IHR6_9BACI|nr:hypothetical protein [Gracilibacillus kekensis]SHM40260.1 hypothetical protein SAMN05216179_0057 [Gracilibacillus kekensis]